MKLVYLLLFFLPLFSGCKSTNGKENETKNPVKGRVFVFSVTIDPSLNPENNNYLSELAFLDEKKIILSYSENYVHKFVNGTYHISDSIIDLKFDLRSYYVYYPDVPATSAVDTIQYGPEIIEEKCIFTHVKLELNDNKQELRTVNRIRKQIGLIEKGIGLEDFKNGLRLQKLEFLLEE